MARKTPDKPKKRRITSYEHRDKERVNNPPVGLVTPDTDPDAGQKRTYAYDPHLDPQLVWAGKAEHTSFDVPTVSLHVHERIDPRTIIEAVRKRNGNGHPEQMSLFETEREEPLRAAVDFYKHAHGWTNRLAAGDSLLVMNSLLEKEGMAGKVQMIYIDPPYGIRYGSNFQPFVNKRDVKDGKDEDLTAEPEQIRAFRDTWELGIHSYLTYLRDRLLLARDLLAESGSVFVQISDENVHHVRELMDEVFGACNCQSFISFLKTSSSSSTSLSSVSDYILWYAKDGSICKYRPLFEERSGEGWVNYSYICTPDASFRRMTKKEQLDWGSLPKLARVYRRDNLTSQRPAQEGDVRIFEFEGNKYTPGRGTFKTDEAGLTRLKNALRLEAYGTTLAYRRYADDFPFFPLSNQWVDTLTGGFAEQRYYVVQTIAKTIQRCLLMTTDPGDLVLDPTCGSGTTAYVAEQWGRRWITCDTSRVALALAKQRLMTAVFDYYELARPNEGVGSGFVYKTVPHVTLKSIANNPDIKEGMTRAEIDAAIARHAPQETLYDQPKVDRKKTRVSGPFTVEAVPAPAVKAVEDLLGGGTGFQPVDHGQDAHATSRQGRDALATPDNSIARTGETLRQDEWRDELLRTGIRGKQGQRIDFARLEPLPGCRWLHADGETRPNDAGPDLLREGKPDFPAQRIVVSFGPDHAPLEQRQVEHAWEEARTLKPTPKLLVFAAFQFDPEAAKDIDELKPDKTGMQFLKAQMNADLLIDDLKKKRASNESFWLIGQPDVEVNSEQWIVNSAKEALAPYDAVAKLSGLDSMAEINGLGRDDLSLLLAIAQRGDLWAAVATDAGSGIGSSKHCGGAGAARDGGIPAFPWRGPGLPGRIGDAAEFVREIAVLSSAARHEHVERLRGSREITDRARQIAARLSCPLSTIHYSQVTIHGFDYYNTKTGELDSGGANQIAVWLLDTDYDGRSLFPRQVFFPMAGAKEGWAKLAKNLKAEIDEDLIEAYRGTVSLPFEPGEHKRIAVKIVDDRGIESLRILGVD